MPSDSSPTAAEREAGRELPANLRVFPRRGMTTVEHWPLAAGQVVVRWTDYDKIGDGGFIVEANVGGTLMETGHYGSTPHDAIEAACRVAAALEDRASSPAEPPQGGGA